MKKSTPAGRSCATSGSAAANAASPFIVSAGTLKPGVATSAAAFVPETVDDTASFVSPKTSATVFLPWATSFAFFSLTPDSAAATSITAARSITSAPAASRVRMREPGHCFSSAAATRSVRRWTFRCVSASFAPSPWLRRYGWRAASNARAAALQSPGAGYGAARRNSSSPPTSSSSSAAYFFPSLDFLTSGSRSSFSICATVAQSAL